MKPIIPASITNQDEYNKSIGKVLNGNVSPGNGLTFDPNGQPLTYSTDNMSGIIIRIGSLANPYSLPAHWTASNTDLTIAHNLNKVPYGYIVIAKSKTCDVYWGSIAATKTTITLRITDDTADTTIQLLA
jgi:hypothetical protein